MGTTKACLLQSMLEEIGYKVDIRILSDVTAATAKGRRCGPRQDVVEAGKITLCHLSCAESSADLLSEPLTGDRHLKFRRELGLRTQYTDQTASQSRSTVRDDRVCMLSENFEVVGPKCSQCLQ